MELLVIAAVLGLIPASIASGKGRSFAGWWFYGLLLFIIALIHSLLIKDSPKGERDCPMCAEPIKADAVVCKHCGRDVPRMMVAAPPTPEFLKKADRLSQGVFVLGGLFFGLLIVALAIFSQ